MNFIRKPLWVLFAFLALGCQSSQAMEWKEGSTTFPKPIQALIVKELFMVDRLQENKSFEDVCRNLPGVCNFWHTTIKTNVKNWVCEYFNIEEKHKDDFWRYFTKGKLIYANPNSNNRQAFFFSAAPNPFKHTFNLSKGNDAVNYMSFHLGIPENDKEFAAKIQTWIFFSPDVEKKLETTAQHLKPIFPVTVPVGMLWTWGKCKQLDWFDYLTTESPENLSKINIYENWEKSDRTRAVRAVSYAVSVRPMFSSFVCELK